MIAAALAFVTSPLGRYFAVGAAVLVALGLVWNAGRSWEHSRAEAQARAATVKAYQQRAAIDRDVAKMDAAGLCKGLGGSWNADTKECD